LTQERFFQLTNDPELLRRITYEELKTLALAYPYAHNLRSLLALKARQIDHPEATRDLATAAAYSLDRTRLFLLVAPQMIVPQQVLAPEEVLELKPIETVKRELEALAPVARSENVGAAPIASEATPPAVPVSKPAEEPPVAVPEVEVEIPEPTAPEMPATQSFADWVGVFQPPILEAPSPKPTVPIKAPTAIEPVLDADALEDERNLKENARQPGIAQQYAERSVAENQDVISETLAKLYAKQGYRDKSAQMYARLALLFPEKSAYFAAEIDKLKK
jgi:hypothetical protein